MDERLTEIDALHRTSFPAFLRTATAILGDADAARDAVQDAFATAVRRRGDFRGEGSLEGWVWRILVNTARSGRRARLAAVLPLRGADGSVVGRQAAGPPRL